MGRMAVVVSVRLATGAFLLAAVTGCSGDSPCVPLPPPATEALLRLSCAATDVTSVLVSVTGGTFCTSSSTSDASFVNEPPVSDAVYVSSQYPGVCHVELTFATGFSYATDVTFTAQTRRNCGTSESYTGPTQDVFEVDNPSATCMDAAANEATLACTTVANCSPGPSLPQEWCCINGTCVNGQAAEEAIQCTDANVQLIQASDYDQSCQTDSDCVLVAEGNFCVPGANVCPSAAINRSGYPQYQADVAKTNAAACMTEVCGANAPPCCAGGVCQIGVQCFFGIVPADADDGSSD